MATAVLTLTNLYSQSQDNLISLIDNRTYVKDPRNPRGINNRKLVYEFDPFMKLNNFGEFPYIVVEFPELSYPSKTLSGKKKKSMYKHTVTIRALRDGAGNARADVGRADMMSMVNDLETLFNDETTKAIFRALNMYNVNFTIDGTSSVELHDGRSVYETSATIEYDTFLVTSN